MKKTASTKQLVITAMFAALILLATSVIKISTPAFGYIHLGDAFVLLAGLFLGPLWGGLAAGIGSALSDLIGGYVMWVPGTFVIKFLCALLAAKIYAAAAPRAPFTQSKAGNLRAAASVIIAGTAGESVMVAGYFLFDILVISLSGDGLTAAAAASAVSVSAAGIPFNIVQGVSGILLCMLLTPAFAKISRGTALQGAAARTRTAHPGR